MEPHSFVQLFHILFVSSILFYTGLTRDQLAPVWYYILLGLGGVIFVYHLYKATIKKHAWVNYIHMFLIAPLLIYIGLQKEKTERKFFEMLLLLAFASLGYHSYYFIQNYLN